MDEVTHIRIVCDVREGHSQRRPQSVVTVFQHIEEGGWTTHVDSKRVQRERTALGGSVDSGLTLVGDDVYSLSEHGTRPDRTMRAVYPLRCPKCQKFPVDATEAKLFPILDGLRHAGVDFISLRALAAKLGRMAKA